MRQQNTENENTENENENENENAENENITECQGEEEEQPTTFQKKKTAKEVELDLLQKVAASLATPMPEITLPAPEVPDDLDIYGKMVATRLRELKEDPFVLMEARHQIDNALFQAQRSFLNARRGAAMHLGNPDLDYSASCSSGSGDNVYQTMSNAQFF